MGTRPKASHTTALRRFSTGSSAHEVISPDEIALMDSELSGSADGGLRGATDADKAASFESLLAWSTTHSPSLPSTFVDVEQVDPFARPRVLSFVRRYRTDANRTEVSVSSSSATGSEFVTEELPTGGVFHARLHLPVTPAGAHFIGYSGDGAQVAQGLWAHGVANTAKDAELLAAMHAERMADLLGYHLYSLPSKQRKHAEAARLAGRYASSPDDKCSGPSAQERRAQWPLPLRRVLTDEETEGGKWQLVDTSAAATHLLCPDHTLLSPCILDSNARVRIEAKFARAPSGCPSFTQQLSIEKVRTLTPSSVAEGGAEFMVAQLTLPPELTALTTPITASGKAVDRATAVLLACMHAELLLDALHIPLFDDPEQQSLHTAAAWSFGRPAPIAGAKPKNPSHIHLPEPLKQLVVLSPGGRRTSMRSAEEEYFHRHNIVTEQTGTFIETTVAESTAVAVLSRFLEAHNAPRAAAAFLRTPVAGRFKSTVLLPLPDSYGIRGGVGIATSVQDADTLAAMHALDVLCMLDIPVTVGDSDLAARTDAAWKAARREHIPDVPPPVSDITTPSPPARRCSLKTCASVVSVEVSLFPAPTTATATSVASTSSSHTSTNLVQPDRRRVAKRAKASPESTAHPPPAPLPSPQTTADETAEREARLSQMRTTIDSELWDLKADSPDGYIMISPGAQQASAVAQYAIVSPRKLDKHAKSRVIGYLSTVGRRLDDVRIKQTLDENDTEGRPRQRCALKIPLPSVCGEPRLALGEADNIADAEHAACMHAELMLDELGVCIYADSAKQLLHAEACAQWGRWAPTGPGQEKPSTTPSPPPLRREYTGSLHWERKVAKTAKRGAGFAPNRALDETPKATTTGAFGEVRNKSLSETEVEDDVGQYEYVAELDIDPVARNRVQYFLRHERLTAGTPKSNCFMSRNLLLHTVAWDLPMPARLVDETKDGVAPGDFSYTVQGTASTRKDAETLSWMHAERLLDALGLPIFPNLPQLQAYHATQAEKHGRNAPKLTCDPLAPLPPVDRLPIKPLRLEATLGRFSVNRPVPPALPVEDAASRELWEKYVTDCDNYITATRYAANNLFFSAGRVPRTGDTVIDAALTEAEAAPLNTHSRALLILYAKISNFGQPRGWVARIAGELHNRILYTTVPTPGFEYVTACGVGENKHVAQLRASMHALAILRRIDPNYEDTYVAAKAMHVLSVNKSIDGNSSLKGEDLDDFDLDAFSTLPSITAEAQRLGNVQSQRFRSRLQQLFVSDPAKSRKHDNSLTEDGKRRAVEMYVLCCGIAKPVEKSLVRLMPRTEGSNVVATPSTHPDLKLEVKQESASDEDEKERRVLTGATYATEISLTDEDGYVWTARGAGFGPHDNCGAAYDKLYDMMIENVPLMKKVTEILRLNVYLRPEDIPCVEIPDSISERMQACLRNQKDLLLAESETGIWDSEEWQKSVDVRWQARQRHLLQLQEKRKAFEPRDLEASEAATLVAAESASLLERLQQRITSSLYLEKYALKRSKLSIAEHKAEILQAIRKNPVVIICGTTGCGKTTQIPQYILDEATQQGVGGSCHILVTQPRRLSTVSIAKRVAEERVESVGESTGYIIRFDSKPGQHITFLTTGVLLRLLRVMPTLPKYTHLIIDEIHERDLFTDFLLVLLRDLVATRPDLRLVLMSATLQASEFQHYFNGAPLIQVQGYMFPVKELYLEDLVPYAREQQRMTPLLKEAETAIAFNSSSRSSATAVLPLDSLSLPAAAETAAVMGSGLRVSSDIKVRYDVLEVRTQLDYPTILFAIEQATRMTDLSGSSILVFLPGWTEIKMLQQMLERIPDFYVLPLHSAVGQESQMRCFLPAPPGKLKVILSTNIAESGVTIDDVGAVIDCGRIKEKSFATRTKVLVPRTRESGFDYYDVTDSSRVTNVDGKNVQGQSRFSQLLEVWASRANCVQRRGRVGRTRPGVCMRLYSREHFEKLHQYQTPEMLRTPLDTLCLIILSLRVGTPTEFLGRAMEPPLESEVKAAVKRLTDLGAVSMEGQLTALGYRLSQLPTAPNIGKMLLLGATFRCLDSALTVAAATQGDVFVPSRDERAAVRLHREDLSMGTLSDTLAGVNAYNFWGMSKLQKTPAQVAHDLKARCLSVPRLLQVSYLKRQLFDLLVDSGFVSMEAYKASTVGGTPKVNTGNAFFDASEFSRNAVDVGLNKAVIAAGLFPNIGVLSGRYVVRTGFENFVKFSTESVLRRSNCQSTSNPFLVYRDLNRIDDVKVLSVADITIIPLWAILLMGAKQVSTDYMQDLSLCVVDRWLYFRISFRALEQVRKFKALLDRRLGRKFVEPNDPTNNAQLEMICGILSDLMNAPLYPNRELYPSVQWGEAGKIIPIEFGMMNSVDNDEDSPEGEISDEEIVLE
ncbi:putative RNA editing associated helicase 2 [Leptomonas seymouri]|uniref:RNA helicase n=1 Tax=Leptomonas seymouri TaxID=5684 RepID=A0A0N1I3X4_LEPSE|nr:putative RNA editing associated helicase 2 [Leptomonas seymouri]|eukprot:KPI84885.1 putative RNA editing associated helicase 2 [Leptomonas seymouri]